MRIGIICHRGVGGSARVAVELAGELSERGHVVHLFARTAPFEVADGFRGVRLHTLQDATRLCPLLDTEWSNEDLDGLTELIVAAELDVLHYHYAMPFALVAHAVCRRLGRLAPVSVGTLHGSDVTTFGRRPAARRALGPALAATDALTTVSHSHARLATRLFGLGHRPAVIPNFIDVERFRPDLTRRAVTPRIAHVSNLRPVKRPAAMAAIFAAVSRETGAELWLVGDGEAAGEAAAILMRADVQDRVVRFGLRHDLEAILPAADMLLVTSRTESFCLAALEAAACGLPVVAPRVGGLPEVVRHDVTGLLYAPTDNRAAEAALLSLIDDPVRRARLGAAARTRATELSADRIVPRYERVYADLLARRAGPATIVSARP